MRDRHAWCRNLGRDQFNVAGMSWQKNVVQQTQPPSTLKVLDLEQKPGFVEQHRLGMMTIGGWVNQKLGQNFKPVQAQHADAAIVYLYQ